MVVLGIKLLNIWKYDMSISITAFKTTVVRWIRCYKVELVHS